MQRGQGGGRLAGCGGFLPSLLKLYKSKVNNSNNIYERTNFQPWKLNLCLQHSWEYFSSACLRVEKIGKKNYFSSLTIFFFWVYFDIFAFALAPCRTRLPVAACPVPVRLPLPHALAAPPPTFFLGPSSCRCRLPFAFLRIKFILPSHVEENFYKFYAQFKWRCQRGRLLAKYYTGRVLVCVCVYMCVGGWVCGAE